MLKDPTIHVMTIAAISAVAAAVCVHYTDHFAYWPRFAAVFGVVAATYSVCSLAFSWLFQPLN